jgi:enoyl-CoA hydratase
MFELENLGDVARLRLVHGKANALDLELLEALEQAVERVRTGPARALVLAGGPRIFCAGVDLLRLLREGEHYVRRFLPALDRLLLALYRLPLPVVAAVAGHAIAGGCVLACTADRRLGARGARLAVPELQLGVPFPLVPLELVAAVVPAARHGDVLWQGRTVVGEEALATGLLDELLDAEAVEPRALAVAAELARLDGPALRWNKELRRRPLLERFARENAEAAARALELWTRPEARAAIERYVQATFKPG